MPIVEVTLAQGRSPEKIRSMISGITGALVDAEVAPKEAVRVIVREIPAAHFAVGDVTLAERTTESSTPADTRADSPDRN